jgi:hypothetical protein
VEIEVVGEGLVGLEGVESQGEGKQGGGVGGDLGRVVGGL